MGFVPTSLRAMAHRARILRAVLGPEAAVMSPARRL